MTVTNCTFNGTTNGLRLKAGRGTGGLVQNVGYDQITMTKEGRVDPPGPTTGETVPGLADGPGAVKESEGT
jgi:polygalacturonase